LPGGQKSNEGRRIESLGMAAFAAQVVATLLRRCCLRGVLLAFFHPVEQPVHGGGDVSANGELRSLRARSMITAIWSWLRLVFIWGSFCPCVVPGFREFAVTLFVGGCAGKRSNVSRCVKKSHLYDLPPATPEFAACFRSGGSPPQFQRRGSRAVGDADGDQPPDPWSRGVPGLSALQAADARPGTDARRSGHAPQGARGTGVLRRRDREHASGGLRRTPGGDFTAGFRGALAAPSSARIHCRASRDQAAHGDLAGYHRHR
jgi:hypothetical protein